MTIKKGDFVELDYTGKIKDDNKIFDTTIQKVAEDAGLLHKHEPGHDHDHSDQYSPVKICVGEKHVLPGLDEKMEGLDIGKHTINLEDVHAFGKKDAKLVTLLPMSLFKKQEIKPFAGLELNIDGRLGIVRSVSGGRVLVDFNHPLASKDIIYDLDIKKIITDNKEKMQALLKLVRLPNSGFEIKDSVVTIKLDQVAPEQYLKMFSDDVKRLTGLTLKYEQPKTENKQ